MSSPITVTVGEASVIAGTTITVSQANIVAGGSVAVTVSNSPIASGAGKTVVSSGGIADLTSTQQEAIGEGTVVVTTDGYRYIYSGGGSKTNPASYVILADITPEWSAITGKPSTFTPSSHASAHGSAGTDPVTVAIAQVTGLQASLDGKAATGHTHTVSDVSFLQNYLDARVSSAVPFTANHTAARSSNYVIGDLVHYEGNIYRAIANNDGIEPQANPAWENYWALVGNGYRHNIDIKDVSNYWLPPESATEGYVLTYQSGAWVAAAAPAELPSGTTGQVLTHDGTAWTASAGYSLPTATDTVLGGVKIGSGVTITDGVISVSTAYAAASHSHSWADITSGTPTTLAGYGITDAVDSSDARLTDARTPTAHSATHATGGSDALTAADIGAAASSHSHAAGDITSGTVATSRLGSGTAGAYTWLAGDSAWKTFAFIPGYSGFADADDWATRVTTNGGSVSASTMTNVYQFCLAIAAAGLRDRFFRLNLFAGTGLASALVPLFRGPTRTGTQYGNTTDTNTNFVSGDYVETGSTGGLQGLRTATKRLETGVSPSTFSGFNFHCSAYEIAASDTTYDNSVGAWAAASNAGFSMGTSDLTTKYECSVVNNGIQLTQTAVAGHYIFSQTGNRVGLLIGSGGQITTAYAGGANLISDWSGATWGITIYALQQGAGSFTNYSSSRMGGYSFGLSLTAAQAAAFYAAMEQFQAAMGRKP